jgi:IS5 family transposase
LGQILEGDVLRAVLDRVVGVAVERKVTGGRRLRVDTTVVEAPIRYPTDSGLCEDGIRVLHRGVRRLVAGGIRLRGRVRDVRRSVGRRLREIGQALRRRGEAARAALRRPYRRLLRITRRVVREAQRSVGAARRQLRQLPPAAQRQVRRHLTVLGTMLPRVKQIVHQTSRRIGRGVTTGADKLVSLFEPYAQILRRGKLHRPTEFGALVKIQETEGGIVTDIALVEGTNDAPLLVPAVEGHGRRFGRPPRLVAVDRGFYSTDGERRVRALGVHHPVIPKPGFRSRERLDYERQRWFRRGRAWRAGGEARIARLKHRFGMLRSRYRGKRGMVRTIYWAAIANNLTAIASRVG